jgi:hypothetical protein
MRRTLLALCAALTLTDLGLAGEPAITVAHIDSRVRALLAETGTYAVERGAAPATDASAELVVGSGSGHGGDLTWYRFRPAADGVDVLVVALRGERQYRSTWPPDEVPVTVFRATMGADGYEALLEGLAAIAGSTIRPKPTQGHRWSSGNFWAFVDAPGVRAEFVGYPSTDAEPDLVRPRAMVALVRWAEQTLAFETTTLRTAERTWASARFTADVSRLEANRTAWWVVERSIEVVGVVGDVSALPGLHRLLDHDDLDRRAYYAINAVTRLVGEDVRTRPIEEMDVASVRQRVKELLDAR